MIRKKTKQNLLAESRYIHDFDRTIDIGNKKPLVIGLDIDRCNTLSHIYLNPDMIIVKSNIPEPPKPPSDRLLKEGDMPQKPKNFNY